MGRTGTRTARTDPARVQALAECFDDFEAFCRLIDVVTDGKFGPEAGTRCKLNLTPFQAHYCRSRTPRDVILKPRRVGMTTVECARDVWFFLSRRGANVVCTCQSTTEHSGTKLLSAMYEVMLQSIEALGIELKFKTRTTTDWVLEGLDSSLRIIEAGASEAAAAKKGRGGRVDRLHLSETAYYEFAEKTMLGLLESVPRPEHGSEVVSESTPYGAAGYFYKQCQDARAGTSGYKLHFFPWFDVREYRTALGPGEVVRTTSDRQRALVQHKRISAEQLKWYLEKLAEKGGNEDLLGQEYPSDPDTCFLLSGRAFFDPKLVAAMTLSAKAPAIVEEQGRLRIWKPPQRGSKYVIGADTSEGQGGDPSAGIVLERGTGEHVATLHGQYSPWDFGRKLSALGRRYNLATIAVERNNTGHATIAALTQDAKYPMQRLYRTKDCKLGWLTNEATRAPMLDAFDDNVRKGVFSTNDAELLGEMKTFIIDDTGKPTAAPGCHDDLIIGGSIAWTVATRSVGQRGLALLNEGPGEDYDEP